MVGHMRYEIVHLSRYRYASAARGCAMALCLQPLADARQRLLAFSIRTDPPAPLTCTSDGFGNAHHLLTVHREHRSIEIAAHTTVEVAPVPDPPPQAESDAWETVRSRRNAFAEWDFTHASPLARSSPALDEFVAAEGIAPTGDPLNAVAKLADAIHEAFDYAPGTTSAESPIEHILASRRGVCQDYTHVMIAIARSWGIPARYVSGYLHVPDAGGPIPGNATHAWAECLLPGAGWVGFDPTNRGLAGEGHIRIAIGRDYRDVSPTRGVRQGGDAVELDVEVTVRAVGDPA